MRRFRIHIVAILVSLTSVFAVSSASSGGLNAPEHLNKPTVLMISIDGFRADYLEKFNPPNLNAMAKEGVRSVGLLPSFPSLTFPNHITLVTGRYPGRHGIVSNTFHDEAKNARYSIGDGESVRETSWYLSDALWTVAEKSAMVSGVFFWVGSESNIGGVPPTYMVPYNDDLPNADRVAKVKEWLSLPCDKRPHWVGLYFSAVDSAGHKYGTDAAQTRDAVLEIDSLIGSLDRFVQEQKLDVNIIVVSDHGMANLDPLKIVEVGRITDISGFKMADKGAVMMLYSDDEAAIEKAYADLKQAESHFKVYRRSDVPKEYHYDHPTRVGDLVLVADLPYYLLDKVTPEKPLKLNAATHGWDPKNKEMHALFIAKGPQIKSAVLAPTFENVHVFPFVLEILGLKATNQYDGDAAVLHDYLK